MLTRDAWVLGVCSRIVFAFAVMTLVPALASASAGCDPAVTSSIVVAQRLVESLRADKPGLARVYARDGSEFTAGQAQWMRGQLRKVERLCASAAPADQAEAERVLAEVRELIVSRHRGA